VSAWSRLAPYVEPALTLGTGMAAEVPAGLAGLAGLLFEGDDPEKAAKRIEAIREQLTYLPRSEGGMANLEAVAGGIESAIGKVEDAAQWATGERQPFEAMASWVNKRAGPEAATALYAAPEAIGSALGFRAGQMARSARRAGREARRASQDLPAIAADIPRLPHAQTARGVHFGREPGLTELDPEKYGTGLKGAEASRLEDAPDIRPRSYFYLDDREKGERGTGPYRYQAELQDLYDLTADPLGIRKSMRERFTAPQDARINPGMIDWQAVQNETERRIRELGYQGYMTPGGQLPAAVMFGRTPVTPYPTQR
jgi:hypothetical protein